MARDTLVDCQVPQIRRSEPDSHGPLERARPARSEYVRGPAGGLSERTAREISAMAGEVRFVVQVEHLTDQRQTPALAKHERPAQAQIQRVEIVTDRQIGRTR